MAKCLSLWADWLGRLRPCPALETCNMPEAMEQESLPTEVILSHPRQTIGNLKLDWNPQPGAYLDIEGETYAVLERHHCYQYRRGKYRLHKIALYVQAASRPEERSWFQGRWVLGNAACAYSAHSELVRCAVNPDGPCQGCRFFEPAA